MIERLLPALFLCATTARDVQETGDDTARAPYSFVVLGHLRGDQNGELLQNLDEVLGLVRRLEPDLVFLTGDLVWGDVNSEHTDVPAVEADWDMLDRALSRLGVPVHRVPGNHDINDLATRDVYWARYGQLPRAFSFRGSRFLLLSSAWIPADGDERKHPESAIRGQDLGAVDQAFLAQELAAPPGYDHAFLFMHHMLWWEEAAQWWLDVHPVLAKSRVRAVFAGDYGPMKFSHLVRDGVQYLQSSVENHASTEMLRTRELSRQLSAQFDNFLYVTVDGPAVHYEVRTVGAMSTGKFSPERWREVNEYDKGSWRRRLYKRWGDPQRLWSGALTVASSSAAFGLASGLGLSWWLARRRRKAAEL